MCLNSSTEKSEASAACLPSFPTIPTPTFAHYIMPTSFPPSPTLMTRFPEYFFKSLVTSAFYFGAHLQHTTAGA